jgi:hypothetical protein
MTTVMHYVFMELEKRIQRAHYEKDEMYIEFFPEFEKAYVECEGQTFWFECSGPSDARDIYYDYHKRFEKIC